MRIIFDIDGTMTDYHAYIETYALPWFYKRYGLCPIKPDRLELEDILDLQAMLQMRHGCTPLQAERKARKLLDRYWISHRSIHYLLLTRFRPGCRAAVKQAKACGAQPWIYTSRAHTARRDLIGGCARLLTMGQLWLNGVWVKPSRIRFFQDDQEKLEGILRAEPQFVFDDKVEILEALRQRNIPAVCVAGPYNTEIRSGAGMERITEYSAARMEELLKKVMGKKAADQLRIARADRFWKRIVWLMPLVRWYLDPVVLHADRRIRTKDAVLYAPNHRSTLDPLAILSVVEENIHWAALLRFFQAKDSIFNNSKNPFLCRLTAWSFHELAYFPIDRKTDDPNADNLAAIRDMAGFLGMSEKVGLFGEGTTRRPEGREFGVFDRSIAVLAKRTGAWIQPVTISWRETGKKRKQPIINFGPPFKVGDQDVRSAMETFLQIQREGLRENRSMDKVPPAYL